MLRKLLSTVLFMAFFVPAAALAQTGSIEGTVTDAETGETVPGANVLLIEANRGAATDAEGHYEISGIEPGTYTLRVTFVGYQTYNEQVVIEAGETIQKDIQLQMGALGLDEVVVTGYGTVSKRSFTGSVAQVTTENLESIPVVNVTQSLQGAAPGLQISSISGTPGSVQEISIRGLSSVNAETSPLFVIDGVPVISGEIQVSTSTSSLGLLASLSPSAIESITVLKDASATAQYGARGANGVIVITTKEGFRGGDTRFSFSVQRGFSEKAVPGPDPLSAAQWDELYTEVLLNAGFTEAQAQSPWDGETYTKWGEVATDDNAVTQEFRFSAMGGSDNSTYFASLGFQDQEGTSFNTFFNRLSGRLNYGYELSDNVTLDNNFSGSYVSQEGSLEGAGYFGSPILAKYFMLPIDKVYNPDGTYNIDGLSNAVFHPLYTAENDIDRKRTFRILNNTTLEANLTDNLAFSSRLGLDYIVNEEKYYDNPVYGDGATTNGSAGAYYIRNFNWVWQNKLDYAWQVNEDNVLNFKLLQEAQQNKYYLIQAFGQSFATTGLTNLASAGTPTGAYSYSDDWSILAFMGSANYGFQNKLYLDASFRYEGNSRFAEGSRWGSFWALGAAYVLTEEELFSNMDWLSFLKVRASYGVTGNANIDLNEYQAFLGYGAAYNGAAGIIPAQLGNSALTWEKGKSLDLGLDIEVFDRVSAEFTYFRKESNDLLFDVPLSFTTGHDEQRTNIGSLINNGVEATVDFELIQTSDIFWNIGAGFTYVHNEITALPQDANGEDITIETGSQYDAVNGYAIGSWYMRKWAGVDPQTGSPLWYVNGKNGATTSNYLEAEKAYQGASAMPTHYGSINTQLNVKGFFLSADLYYSFGNKIYDGWAYYMMSDGAFNTAFNQYAMQYNRWQEPGDITNVPKLVLGGNRNSNLTSTRFLYDGSYLRLQTVRVGYNLPASLLSDLNLGLSSASIYLVGNNVWTHVFDDQLKFDPDVSQSGFLDLYAAPLKTYTLGLKVNF